MIDSETSKTLNGLRKKLRNLNTTDRIFVSYVPEQGEYDGRFEGLPKSDYFHLSKKKDLSLISSKVEQMLSLVPKETALSYKITSTAVAELFRISPDNIGDVFCFKKTSPFVNNDSSSKFDGVTYHVSKFRSQDPFDIKTIKSCLVNDVVLVEHSGDMDNLMSNMRRVGMEDLLVVGFNGENTEKLAMRLSRVNRAITKGENPIERRLGIALVKDPRTLQDYVAIFLNVRIDQKHWGSSSEFKWKIPKNKGPLSDFSKISKQMKKRSRNSKQTKSWLPASFTTKRKKPILRICMISFSNPQKENSLLNMRVE